jgi:hypothetical protein
MILEDSIKVNAKPEAVFRFFEEMDNNHYRRWHTDHVHFRWVSGRGMKEGNICYFEERVAGKLFKKQVVYTRVIPNQYIEFAPTFWLMRLFLPRMIFRLEPEADGCRLSAEVHMRLGPLAQWAHQKELAAVRQHMRDEGLNLKNILEQEEPQATVAWEVSNV